MRHRGKQYVHSQSKESTTSNCGKWHGGADPWFSGLAGADPWAGGTNKATAPSRSGRTQEPRSGDWTCRECNDIQFGSRDTCRRCSRPKPPSAGDWKCLQCNKVNNGDFAYCGACAAPKEGLAPSQSHSLNQDGTDPSSRGSNSVPPQPAPPQVTPKIGDRVKVSTTQRFGVIIVDSKDSMPYKVKYDEGDQSSFLRPHELEVVEQAGSAASSSDCNSIPHGAAPQAAPPKATATTSHPKPKPPAPPLPPKPKAPELPAGLRQAPKVSSTPKPPPPDITSTSKAPPPVLRPESVAQQPTPTAPHRNSNASIFSLVDGDDHTSEPEEACDAIDSTMESTYNDNVERMIDAMTGLCIDKAFKKIDQIDEAVSGEETFQQTCAEETSTFPERLKMAIVHVWEELLGETPNSRHQTLSPWPDGSQFDVLTQKHKRRFAEELGKHVRERRKAHATHQRAQHAAASNVCPCGDSSESAQRTSELVNALQNAPREDQQPDDPNVSSEHVSADSKDLSQNSTVLDKDRIPDEVKDSADRLAEEIDDAHPEFAALPSNEGWQGKTVHSWVIGDQQEDVEDKEPSKSSASPVVQSTPTPRRWHQYTYVDKDMQERSWWWADEQNWFMESTPGPWQRFDDDGQWWWWNSETDEVFYVATGQRSRSG